MMYNFIFVASDFYPTNGEQRLRRFPCPGSPGQDLRPPHVPHRHEGVGSVYAALKGRGWATQLSAGESGDSFSGRSFFCVSVVLTKEGERPTVSCSGPSSR